jgi:DNA invertase Pin-like site-specific DNA recombinase
MRAALYLRVSTQDQTTDNQERELRAAADRLGHSIVEVYLDHGISGAKGREKRPAFDKLHRDATRRKFDVVMAWSVDRLGRSLQDLVVFLNHLQETKVDLFLHQQGLDTTTSSGRAMFGMLSVFSEFERSIIRERVLAGLARAKVKGTRSGKAIGRPAITPAIKSAIVDAYKTGKVGMRVIGAQFGVSSETVRRCLMAG